MRVKDNLNERWKSVLDVLSRDNLGEIPPDYARLWVDMLRADTEEAARDKMAAALAEGARLGHCRTCICSRRAPVQADRTHNKPAGSITWDEYLEAYAVYTARYGEEQSAERLAERGGFSYGELVLFLGHEPKTWTVRT